MNKMSVIQSHLGMRFSTFILFLDKKCNHMVSLFQLAHIRPWLFLINLGAGWSTLGLLGIIKWVQWLTWP